MNSPASKMKTQNRELSINRELDFQIGQLKFKKAGKCPVEYCILYGESNWKRKIWILKINRAHLEKWDWFFQREFEFRRLLNKNQEFESRPKTEFGNQESGKFELETVDWINLRTKIRDQKLKIWRTWIWFWWIWEIELSKSEIKNQVESSGDWDLNPDIGWLSSDFWLI